MKRVHRCAKCGRRLKVERSVYSRHTKARYCWPGEGCEKRKRPRNVQSSAAVN